MKTVSHTFLLSTLALLAAAAPAVAAGTTSVTLVPYAFPNMGASSYNFGVASQDASQTNNGWDISLQSDGTMQTRLAVGEIGALVDAGASSCAAISTPYLQSGAYPGVGHGGYPYAEDRALSPVFWLEYTDAFATLSSGGGRASLSPQVGHCYLVFKSVSGGRDLALFHVAAIGSDKSVTIDELESFESVSSVSSVESGVRN